MVGFDVTEFLDNDDHANPTIMYLFHRIESMIDGRRIPIFLMNSGSCSMTRPLKTWRKTSW